MGRYQRVKQTHPVLATHIVSIKGENSQKYRWRLATLCFWLALQCPGGTTNHRM